MSELARGSVTDRPWGRTFAAPFLRGITGQLTVASEGKQFLVAFEQGAVVAASSPLAADAAVRVALTGHLVSSSQVPEISRRQAAAPERDEISVIAELARLGPDHALRLRRRVIAQRAARTFSINHGEFVFTDAIELPILEGCELDVRAVIYMGARANLSEHRLSAELDQLGAWFRLKASFDEDLPQFGFGDLEEPIVDRLREGGTLAELEEETEGFVDARTVRAVVYSLAVCNACELVAAEPAGVGSTYASPITAPMARVDGLEEGEGEHDESTTPNLAASASTTQPLYGMPGSAAQPAAPRTMTSTPGAAAPAAPRTTTSTPGTSQRRGSSPPMAAAWSSARTKTSSAHPSTLPMPTVAPATIPPGDVATGRPTPRSQSATPLPESSMLETGWDEPPIDESYEDVTPPDGTSVAEETETRRDGFERAVRRGAEAVLREHGMRGPDDSGRFARRPEDTPAERGSNRTMRGPDDAGQVARPAEPIPRRIESKEGLERRGESDPAVRPSGGGTQRRSESDPALRPPAGGGRSLGEPDWALRPSGGAQRRSESDSVVRPSGGAERRGESDSAVRRSGGGQRRGDSEAGVWPSGGAERRGESDSAVRRSGGGQRRGDPEPGVRPSGGQRRGDPEASSRRRSDSSPALRPPALESSPQLVIRRVAASRPAPVRRVAQTESPQSHEVKALIAQRLKLLDQSADHFALLGVVHDVAPDALRKAYFALARQLHPDRLAALGISDDGKHAQRLFAQINTGFAILSDPARRAKYVHVLRRGGEAAVREEQARAEDLARRIVEAEEAFRRGELALRRDQPQAAVAELELAVQLNPEEADYHALLAWSAFCAAPDKPAIASKTRAMLEKAIQRAPKAVTARLCLGRVERMLGRDQEALRHFRDVLAAVPGHGDAAAEVRVLESRLGGGDKGGGLFGRTKR